MKIVVVIELNVWIQNLHRESVSEVYTDIQMILYSL